MKKKKYIFGLIAEIFDFDQEDKIPTFEELQDDEFLTYCLYDIEDDLFLLFDSRDPYIDCLNPFDYFNGFVAGLEFINADFVVEKIVIPLTEEEYDQKRYDEDFIRKRISEESVKNDKNL